MAEHCRRLHGGIRASLLGALALLALGYAAFCGFMYTQQRDLLYFPQATRVPATATDFELLNDGELLRGWVLNPGRPRALLYFGGNAEAIQHNRDAFAEWFPGHTVYLLAYRGYGASSGDPDEAGLVADALALYGHAAARHGAVDVIGRSLGSGVAAQLAARRKVARLALVTPFDSLVAVASTHYRWLPVEPLLRDRYESARYLADYRGEVLIVRAEDDTVVPAPRTQGLIAALPRPPRVVVLDDVGHNGFDIRPAYREALQAFFAESGLRR